MFRNSFAFETRNVEECFERFGANQFKEYGTALNQLRFRIRDSVGGLIQLEFLGPPPHIKLFIEILLTIFFQKLPSGCFENPLIFSNKSISISSFSYNFPKLS